MTKFVLPPLPYAYDALEPVILAEIMELHHKKHHQGYVTNLNSALEKYEQAEKKEDLDQMVALQPAIRFNGGGHINHSLFWENLLAEKEYKAPNGEFANVLNQRFGSLDKFIEEFNTIVGPLQGSGWGWLGFCPKSRQLRIATTANQDPLYATTQLHPLLGVDVWEHAYYLQYKNVRPEYLKAIWRVVNWKVVQKRFLEVSQLAQV